MLVWIGFLCFIGILLALDLGVFHRKAHVISVREALGWSVSGFTALLFSVFVYFGYENHWLGLGLALDAVDAVRDFLTAVPTTPARPREVPHRLRHREVAQRRQHLRHRDDLRLLRRCPAIYQHRVLFWGILGALLMRGVMIGVGAALIAEFHWILYVFGAFLIVTASRCCFMGTDHGDPTQNFVVRLVRRLLPVTAEFHGEHFFVRAGRRRRPRCRAPRARSRGRLGVTGALMLTPLALALVMVETTDLIFAVDSIPAIFAITADPFLVFTSNVFAILGLRSLYFALAGMIDKFRYLKVSLASSSLSSA